MATRFHVEEILKIAVNIEKNGITFYQKAAEVAETEPVRKLMKDLAAWEAQHARTFSAMLDKYDDGAVFELDPENNVAGYLQAIADGKVFQMDNLEGELPQKGEDPFALIDRAVQREKDAIIFFLAMKEMVTSEQGRKDIEEVIQEEMSHISFLLEKKLTIPR